MRILVPILAIACVDPYPLDDVLRLHHLVIDAGTTSLPLEDCLLTLEGWSGAHPRHHPIVVLVELKDAYHPEQGTGRLAALEDALLAGRGRGDRPLPSPAPPHPPGHG